MERKRKKGLTLQEILEEFEKDEDEVENVDIVVIPPEVDELTDEDEGPDDIIEEPTVLDVPGTVELHVECAAQITVEAEVNKEDANIGCTTTLSPSQCKSSAGKKKRKLCESEPCWRYIDPEYRKGKQRGRVYEENMAKMKEDMCKMTCLEVFESIMTPEIFDFIVRESVRYATTSKNKPDFILSVEELKSFFGILLLSGYNKLTSERHYWSRDEDLGVSLVKNAMSRNRYQVLKSMVHFCNNLEAPQHKEDKGFKIRKFISALQKSFMQYGVFEECLAVDEMMVKYYGRNSLKQFIRGKPVRFGYKLWALCGVSGYCYNFDLYCGKSTSEQENSDLLLGSKVVLQMLKNIEEPTSHSVYFDNLFTGHDLLVHLRELGFQASGTIRENRLRKCPLKSTKDMMKENRGSYDYRFDTNEEILIVKWHDNKCVTVGTNFDTVQPLSRVQRWLRDSKTKGYVPQPNVINNYNKYMGGVDHHDWLVGKYSVSIRGKKWYWPLFTRLLDMAIVNSWIIYQMTHDEKLSLLEFRRSVCVPYMKLMCMASATGQPRVGLSPPPGVGDAKYDGKDHIVQRRQLQRRCQNKPCTSKPRTFCSKCNVTLCVTCFGPYHHKS